MPKRKNQPTQTPSSSHVTKRLFPGNDEQLDVADVIKQARGVAKMSAVNFEMRTLLELLLTFVENQQAVISKLQSQPAQNINDNNKNENDVEAKERARSIVIAGFPESGLPKPSERKKADHDTLEKLLDELGVEAEVDKTYRMGLKKAGNRGRLVKVVLGTSAQQRAVICVARQLKNSARFKGVFVRPSMSKEERDEDYALRKELFERRQRDTLSVESKPTAVFRIGNPAADRINRGRLLKVILPSRHHQRQVLNSLIRRRNELKAMNNGKSVFIRPSLDAEKPAHDNNQETNDENVETPINYVSVAGGVLYTPFLFYKMYS